jgi:uncharacterized membrane protein
MPWFIAIPILGGVNGLRTMTPIALVCWFAYTGHLPVNGTWAFWTGNAFSVVAFTLFALGEYVGDKLPQTPNRTDAPLLAARAFFGGGVGAIMSLTFAIPLLVGAVLGAVSAIAGAFLGFHLRRFLTSSGKLPDLPVALVEDAVGVALAFVALHFAS